eukprot:c21023_g3_i1 orf=113-1462(+)
MRHVWLSSLGVWAQAQEPFVDDDAGIVEATPCRSLEKREGSAVVGSCSNGEGSSTEKRKRKRHGHCHSPHDGHHYHHTRDGHFHHEGRDGGHLHSQAYDGHHQRYHNEPPNHDEDARDDRHRHSCCNDKKHHCYGPPHRYDACDDGHHHSCRHRKAYGEFPQHDQDDSHHTCPICLSPITQSNLTVLRWCMHRFCITCIEKWSCMQRFCPLCKQIFHGWYYNIQSPSAFEKKDLTVEASSQASSQIAARGRRERHPIPRQPTSLSVRRSKPLPWRRAFGFPRRTTSTYPERVAESKADEEALQWRASIYKKNLRAVPVHMNSRVKVKQAPANDPERKARIERRLEPWIRRELQAIMGDPDPSLLVHLALSLWLHAVSEREKITEYGTSGQRHVHRIPATEFDDGEAVRQLEPILQEKASAFWHELRCFAESPYSLRAYDSVIKYVKCRG